ncbi:MAG: hypothetical protein HYV02_06520 [Deltaproteobacteria bacterium]|nr:hypothetical protein [Deltaproteobacteria bacterium]
MAETIDELTINWTDETDGVQKIRELKKEVLTRGSWTTVMYFFEEWDAKNSGYGEPKIRIQRYQKRGGQFIPQSRFNITNAKQAYQIMDVMTQWYPKRPSE